MSEEQPAPPPVETAQDEQHKKETREREKKQRKVRSAWISFIGRIVAQIVGAAATIVLGLALAGRLKAPDRGAETGAGREARTSPRPLASSGHASSARRGASLAVLPLQNLSRDPQQEYFADGMSDALISSLAKIRTLRVISTTSVMQYKGVRKPLPEIARELGVDYIVEGAVVREGPRVRVTAQLIDARSDEHLWSEAYDRPVRDVLALQAELASAIARQVNVVLTDGERGRLAPSGTVSPEAYGFYLKGRYAWNQRTQDGLDSAIRYFTQAIGEDPGYAAAFAGLADSYALAGLGTFGALTPREAMTRAKAAAQKALELDEGLAEAHTSLAWVRFRYDWDFAAAEHSFRRALELNPGYATAHQWYSIYLANLGRHAEALVEARRALDVDPLSPLMHRNLGNIHYLARRFDDAEAEAREAVELDSRALASRLLLVRILSARGEFQGAIEACEQVLPSERNDETLMLLVYAYARAGQRSRAQELQRQLLTTARPRPAAANHLALMHVGLGNTDAAFRELERAVAERLDYVVGLKSNPLLDPLRSDPRFQALLRRVGLPGV